MVANADFSEQALLGAVLRGYKDIPALARMVSEPDFRQPRHGQIWNAILAVHAKGYIPDALAVMDQLGSLAHRMPGGAAYLTELDAPLSMQAPLYAEQVRSASIKRQIADMGLRCRQLENDEDMSPDDMLGKIRLWMEDLEHHHGGGSISGITAALERVVDVAENGEPVATPTPWEDLNEMIGGWYPGQLIIVGARPGVGKSLFIENAATDVARTHKRHVLFVSLEMTAKELTQRTMAHTAKIPLSKIRQGKWDPEDRDWSSLNTASGIIGQTPITFADSPHQTMADIRGAAWEAKQAASRAGEELGLIAVDYLQLVTPRDQRISRQLQVGEMSRGLKQLARELEVPVMAAAQLNRASTSRVNGIPILSDLREAGDIEQDADVVLFLHEQYVQDGDRNVPTGEIQLITAKQRNGPTGTRTLQKHGHFARLSTPRRS